MRLERFVLENYRQYQGRQGIDFAPPGPRNETLVRGLNGAGKTHLLEALHWCLYGGLENEGLREMVSKGTLAASKPGDHFALATELAFEHDGRRYLARRTVRVTVHAPLPDGAGMSFSIPGDVFILLEVEPNGNHREVTAPNDEIAAILPKDASEYFIFDGEKIDKFAKPDNAVGIRAAVDSVLKFAYLDRAVAHIKDVRQEYESELRRLAAGTEIEPLLSQKQDREEQKLRLENELEDLGPKAELIEAQRVVVENALMQTEAQRDKLLERQTVRGELASLDTQAKAQTERLATLISSAYLAFAGPALKATMQEADAKRKRGEIPGKVRQVVVKDLLEDSRCICGRPLEKGSDAREVVERLVGKATSSRLEERVIFAATNLPSLVRRSNAEAAKLEDTLRQQRHVIREMRSKQERLTELDEQLRDTRQDEIRELLDKNRRLEQELQRIALRRQELNREIAELTRELSGLDTSIEKARRQSGQIDAVRRRAVLARDAENALVDTRLRFASEVRGKVESGTSEMFRKLVWKTDHFDRVVIGDDFGLSVVDRWGGPALGDLSMGETELLSLAFIVTMGRVAGEALDSSKAPVVIDSPFGRLSRPPRYSIAENLPGMVDQLVLLVTDTELDGTEEAIQPRIGRRYELAFDATSSCTTAKEVAAHG